MNWKIQVRKSIYNLIDYSFFLLIERVEQLSPRKHVSLFGRVTIHRVQNFRILTQIVFSME